MTRRVLVVDDDRDMVRTLSDILELRGWNARGAYSGAEALQALRDRDYEVVLMDIKMPGMDGVQAFREMKKLRPEVRVILMTAFATGDVIAQAEREGALRVLPKPIDVPLLLELLQQSARSARPLLLVDQDEDSLTQISNLLHSLGYETIGAESLDDAVDALEQQRPSVVLLHVELDGGVTQDSVLAIHEMSASTALILYSSRRRALDDVRKRLPSGYVYAYLTKPFAVEELTAILDDVIDD